MAQSHRPLGRQVALGTAHHQGASMKDLFDAIRTGYRHFRADFARRRARSKRHLPDPFTPAIENTVKRIIREQKETA